MAPVAELLGGSADLDSEPSPAETSSETGCRGNFSEPRGPVCVAGCLQTKGRDRHTFTCRVSGPEEVGQSGSAGERGHCPVKESFHFCYNYLSAPCGLLLSD